MAQDLAAQGGLPGGPPWPARGMSQKFFLASGVHHGVSEAKMMVVVHFDGETVSGGVGEACDADKVRRIKQCSWSRQNRDLV